MTMMTDSLKTKIDELNKKYDVIRERLCEARAKGDLSNNTDYDYWRGEQSKISDILYSYNYLTSKTPSLREFVHSYSIFKKWCESIGEEFPILNDRMRIIKEHYHPESLVGIEFDYYPSRFDDFVRQHISILDKKSLDKDLKRVLKYFGKEHIDSVYSWEIEYVTYLMFYDQVFKTHYVEDIFGKDRFNNLDKKCDWIHDLFGFVTSGLDNHKIFGLPIFLVAIQQTYVYLRDKASNFIVSISDLSLVDKVLSLIFKLSEIDFDDYTVGVTVRDGFTLDRDDMNFLLEMSKLFSIDVLHTINDVFPTCFTTNVVYMGYNLYQPAGCEGLDIDMSSVDSIVKSLPNYDMWLEIDGKKLFEKLDFEFK